MQIFILRKGQQYGPYTIEQVNGMLASFHLNLNDFAWHQGLPGWTLLKNVAGVNQNSPYQPAGTIMSAGGVNGQLTLFADKVRISRSGLLAVMTQGLKGDKEILLSSITSIQFRQANALTNGYIQFTFAGSGENKRGLLDATKDENTVMFKSSQQGEFQRMKAAIEQKIAELRRPRAIVAQFSPAEELEKLASLKERGIITEEEFNIKKKQLLGL
ncbi:MAG TPA: DUF4429 domain-containing protein [Pyrinomonadaceae bacterium]